MTQKRFHLIGAIATVVLMWGSIFWMMESRASILRDGVEITLKTTPIDPRDFLRGRYVRLGYGISRIEVADLEMSKIEGTPIYVHLKRNADGWHVFDFAQLEKPESGVFLAGKIMSARRLDQRQKKHRLTVEYGIERFYASESVAPDLEKRMRRGAITDIVLAVNADGKAQIKALKQNKTTFFTEQLY